MTFSIPPIKALYKYFFEAEEAYNFCLSNNFFPSHILCSRCDASMKANFLRRKYRCVNAECRLETSVNFNTFFMMTKLSYQDTLLYGYLWLSGCKWTQLIILTGHSTTTVTAYGKYFRELVAEMIDIEDTIIGGPGIIVEIDETKLGKRKYNRGHPVDGVWVLVGVERTSERKVFCVEVPNREAATLLAVIRRHVLPGSIVNTDSFRSYARINELLNLSHQTVNHSIHYVDPTTGVHTNTVEGTNNALKIMISPRNRVANIELHLQEFVWRRRNAERLWEAFLQALKEVKYVLV